VIDEKEEEMEELMQQLEKKVLFLVNQI